MTQCVLLTVAYRQTLVQQVAVGMQTVADRARGDQENVSPKGAVSTGCQDARLHLVPPTPVGTAPLQAAAVSVANKRSALTPRVRSGFDTMQGKLTPCLLHAAGSVTSCARCHFCSFA